MFTIKNKRLSRLDQKVATFYKLNARYFNSLVNTYGRQVFKKELSTLKKTAAKITVTDEFDQLIKDNIISNLHIQETIIDYFTEPKYPLSSPDMIDLIAGRGSWEFLKQKFINSPWKLRWDHSANSLERGFRLANERTEEAQTLARKLIPQIKNDILKYGKEQGYLPNDFDFQIYLLPPKDEGQYSRWNSAAKVFELGNYGFVFFHHQNGIIIMPTIAYYTAFHEILGHAANQVNSVGLPSSISFTEEIASLTPVKTIVEGIAAHASQMSFGYLKNNLSRLGISQAELRFQMSQEIILEHNKYEYLFMSLIKDRESREKGFKGYQYIAKLTHNPVLSRIYKNEFEDEFIDEWGSFGHTFGPNHFANMVSLVTKKFGQKFLTLNRKKFHQSCLTGVWSWEIYPRAVIWIMQNILEKK